MIKEKKNMLFVFLLCLILCVGLSLTLVNKEMEGDEFAHAVQVQHFIDGEYGILDNLTMPITYHVIIFSLCKFLGLKTLFGMRLVSCLLSLLLLFPISYLITKNLNKTSQIIFFPTMFVFMFLVYTDFLSLIFVLLSFYLITKKHYSLSGLFATLSIFVRQNNIFWVGFILLYGFLSLKLDSYYYKYLFKQLIKYVIRCWSFVLGILIFMFFVFYTGSVIQGDASHHPISLHLGNVYMFLFLFACCFMPYCLSQLKNNTVYAFKQKWPLLVISLVSVGLFFYKSTHEYNFKDGIWFNMLLMGVNNSLLIKCLYAIPIIIAVITLCATRFENKKVYWMYPITFIFLSLSWLVEIRYSFIPLVFFLIFYKNDKRLELITTIYYVLLSIAWFCSLVI